MKDVTLCQATTAENMLKEPLRVLKSGGILEVWDSNNVFRALVPSPGMLAEKHQDHKLGRATGTYIISSGTKFSKAQNKYVQDYNTWVDAAFKRRKLPLTPCELIAAAFKKSAKQLEGVGNRQMAIPLGEVKWETDGHKYATEGGKRKTLTSSQLALRQALLLTVVQMIDGLGPILMEVSGKNRDDWDAWASEMMVDLLQRNGLAGGECLEVAAWWGRKK